MNESATEIISNVHEIIPQNCFNGISTVYFLQCRQVLIILLSNKIQNTWTCKLHQTLRCCELIYKIQNNSCNNNSCMKTLLYCVVCSTINMTKFSRPIPCWFLHPLHHQFPQSCNNDIASQQVLFSQTRT